MKQFTLPDILTESEIHKATKLWEQHGDSVEFVSEVEKQLIAPNMDRINKKLGQENDQRYLAYAVCYVFWQASRS